MPYVAPYVYPIMQWTQIAERYRRGTILLGNGSSIAISPSFLYPSLLEHAQREKKLSPEVSGLFELFGSDFELILRQVWQASKVNHSLKINDLRTHNAYIEIRDCLIKTVRDIHPKYDDVSVHLPNMYQFLKSFETVLSLNYDLLVYWTVTYGLGIIDGHMFKDCFVNGLFDDDWRRLRNRTREYTNTLVFYPHGNLALCRDIAQREFKIHSRASHNLLETILHIWRVESGVPLFVSEGTSEQKISSIQNSYYLSTVFREVLTSSRFMASEPALTILGWGISPQDRQLLKQMKKAGVQRVAVSVHGGNQDYCNGAFRAVHADLGPVKVEFFDSASAGCWIQPMPNV